MYHFKSSKAVEKQRIYTRPKTRDDMYKLFEQVFYEVRHWYANGNTQSGLSKHIRTTFKKRPSDLTAVDLTRANTMTLDEWMDFATAKYYEHLRREAAKMKERREAQPKPAKEEVLPGFENEPKPEPVQTAIDFDKERIADNLGELIIIARKVANALEKIAETAVLLGKCCGDFHGVGPGGLLVENYKFDVNVSQ